jgi:hypothetical protein
MSKKSLKDFRMRAVSLPQKIIPDNFTRCRQRHNGNTLVCDACKYDPTVGPYCEIRGAFSKTNDGFGLLESCEDFRVHIKPRWIALGKYLLDQNMQPQAPERRYRGA